MESVAKSLLEKITESKNGNKNALEMLITEFTPLIKKYSKLLHREDAYEDIQCDFICIVKNFPDISSFPTDYSVLAYIKKSIYTCYIKKSKSLANRKKYILFHNELGTDEMEILNKSVGSEDDYSMLYFSFLKGILTKNEYEIIYLHFFHNFTISEISKAKGIARQNVNKTKIQALKKNKKIP